MFYNISLCPGGAFMMHESAAEYDSNMAIQPARIVPANLNALKEELAAPGCDPVMKLIAKTRDAYDKLQRLGGINLEPDNVQEAITDLSQVSTMASEIAEEMRLRLVKQSSVLDMMECLTYDWMYEDFLANMKTFMLNKSRICQMGYSNCTVQYNELHQVTLYNVCAMLSAYMSVNTNLPDYPFEMDNMRDAFKNYDGNIMDCFATTHDMFNCLYNDPDRLVRLEAPTTQQMDLTEMMNSMAWSAADKARSIRSRNSELELYSAMVAYISRMLREIKRESYDLSCELMETNAMLDRDCYHKKMRSLIAGVYDIFYLSMIWMFSNAYRIRRCIATRDAVSAYVKNTLKALNLH